MMQSLILIFFYIVLLFLILRFTVTLFNFLSNPKLGHYGRKFSDLISIIIFEENDEDGDLIKSICKQDYENIEILTLYNNSILSDLIAKSQGKYLLILDKHTVVKNGLINSMIYRMKVFDLALLSLIPNKTITDFKSRIFNPLADLVLINLLPLRLVKLLNLSAFSAADSRCMFFEASMFSANNWLDEDEENLLPANRICALIKEKKLNSEILIANKMLWDNNLVTPTKCGDDLFRVLGNNISGAFAYLMLVVVGPIVMLWNFEMAFFTLPIGLIFLGRIMNSFLVGQNPVSNVLLHPLQMLSMAGLLISAMLKKLFTKQ
ncbi:hypothetical protein ACVWYN_003731 [Pedobacter sp. UYP24]